MTLVQASICHNGKSIIILGDRLATMSIGGIKYETEGDSSKIYTFRKNAAGFAGDLIDITRVKNEIKDEDCPIDDFAKHVSKIISDLIKSDVDKAIQRFTQHSLTNFIGDTQGPEGTIPNEMKNFVYAEIAEFNIDCETLVAGFDKDKKARIFHIDETGVMRDCSDHCTFSIGSGLPFSKILFDQENYDSSCSLAEGLYFAYRAKKAAELHIGVGPKTDIIMLQEGKDPDFISAESERDKLLASFYKIEKKKLEECRKEILTKIEGVLK